MDKVRGPILLRAVIPAHAGIHTVRIVVAALARDADWPVDPRVRGDDDVTDEGLAVWWIVR